MTPSKALIGLYALLLIMAGTLSIVFAATRQQSTNVEEGKCEVVSVGNYLCKTDGKCYYCDTKTNPDMNKNC